MTRTTRTSSRSSNPKRGGRALIVTLCGTFSLFIASNALAAASEIVPGQVYPGGSSIRASEAGITLSIPAGWKAALPHGSEILLMERDDQQAFVFVSADELTLAAANSQMGQTLPMGEGVVLTPKGEPTQVESGLLRAEYTVSGTERPGSGAVWTRIGPHGIGVAFIALDFAGAGGENARDTAGALARAVRFSAPVAPQPDPGSGEGKAAWLDYMRGRYIAYFFTGSGYSEKEEIWLCSDGSFAKNGEAGGFTPGVASGAFQNSGGGRWTATGTQPADGELILQYEDGHLRYRLSLEDGNLLLDGSKWLRGNNERCD